MATRLVGAIPRVTILLPGEVAPYREFRRNGLLASRRSSREAKALVDWRPSDRLTAEAGLAIDMALFSICCGNAAGGADGDVSALGQAGV